MNERGRRDFLLRQRLRHFLHEQSPDARRTMEKILALHMNGGAGQSAIAWTGQISMIECETSTKENEYETCMKGYL